jgi:hypothetical protein
MKARIGIAAVLLMTLILGAGGLAAQDKPKAQPEKIFIPKQVKTVLQEGLLSRQGRQDIPFVFGRHIYLPARDSLHSIVYFKIKNADLGFAPAAAAPAAPEPAAAAEAPAALQAKFNVFLWFSTIAQDGTLQTVKEVYAPAVIDAPAAGYDPEKVESYSFGYPLPAGRYLLAMAVTSSDLTRIGTGYFEISTPNPGSFVDKLDTTPIFFAQSVDQMQAPETRVEIHKDCFTYSILKMQPKADNVFAKGENLDPFFFIFGLRPNDTQKYSLEIGYEVKKGAESAIRYEAQAGDSPLVSQPLPLKQTVIIKSDKGETSEQRDLEAGAYTLVVTITDKISGFKVEKTIDFEVR